MFPSDPEITLTILISTALLVFFVAFIIYFLFKYQQNRQRHEKEMLQLRESFEQTLLKSKTEIQEQTLDHIAKELHANIGQLASLININLATILEYDNISQRESILETKSMAKQLMAELKGLSTMLNTDYIMKVGFDRALEKEIQRVDKIVKFKTTLKKTGQPFYIDAEREIILFRLCQEAINNTVKYAEATNLEINLVYDNDNFIIIIKDDGKGFDVESAKAQLESTGIMNMCKRAEIINAQINIESKIGKGSKLSIKVPKLNMYHGRN